MFKKKIVKLPELKFAKIRDVKTPSVAYIDAANEAKFNYGSGSAGIDFYVPNIIPIDSIKEKNQNQLSRIAFMPGKNTVLVEPAGRILIPSGIKANIPDGYALIAFNKSGVCANKGLIVGSCCVDSDYQGEIHIHVINTSDNNVEIGGGDKLVQFILFELPKVTVELVDIEHLYDGKVTTRGDGGFGSSCKKS